MLRLGSSMKVFGSLLILVLAMHLQCGALCLAEASAVNTHAKTNDGEPPCHKHADVPSNDQHSSHDGNSPCNQGPTLQSKIAIAGRFALPHVLAVLPAIIPVLATHTPAVERFAPDNGAVACVRSVVSSVLRI